MKVGKYYLILNVKFKDFALSLSKIRGHSYWKEEIPTIPIGPMVKDRKGWLHSGYFHRGGERVDYVTRTDKYICYLRYKGDNRLVSTWQTLFLNQRWFKLEGKVWSGTCPFCCSSIRNVLIYEKSLRCRNCLQLGSRWKKQLGATARLRRAIREGALSKVQESLQGSPKEIHKAMLAMELTGMAPKRLSSPKNMAPWEQVKNRSIIR